jgi:hypothetical protein
MVQVMWGLLEDLGLGGGGGGFGAESRSPGIDGFGKFPRFYQMDWAKMLHCFGRSSGKDNAQLILQPAPLMGFVHSKRKSSKT